MEMALLLNQDKREICFVAVLKGALLFTADLIRHLDIPYTVDFIQAKSYHGTERGELTLIGMEQLHIQNKDVILIDDIFDSGTTLTTIHARLLEKKPRSLKSLVLLSKQVTRKTDYKPDYSLFEVENQFVIGYGLDYNEHYRGLQGIYKL